MKGELVAYFRKYGPVCTFPDCDRKHESHGYCASHAAQLRRTGSVRPLQINSYEGTACSFEDCGRRPYARGLCQTHYTMQRKGRDLRPIRDVRPRHATTARDELGNKQCLTCQDWLPEGEFYASPQTGDGLGVTCKTCMKWGNALRLFSVTPERYEELLAAQGGVCAVCGREPDNNRRLSIDHDHSCCAEPGRSCGNCVRGLLHANCNAGLGFFEDDPDRLLSAAIYLLAYQGVSA